MEVASHRDIIFASRPGLRLWQAGLDGVVQQTLIFKDALMCPHPSIMLVNPVPSRFKLPKVVNGKNKDRRTLNKNEGQPGVEGVYQHQLGYLSPFGDGLIVVHWKGANGSLLVLDTEDTGVITSVKTGPGGLRSIISVAVTPAAIKPAQNQLFDDDSVEQGPEIFVLEGSRSLIRIAYNPDYNYSKGSEEQEEGISSSVRSLFSSAIFPPSLPSPPPLLKDLTTSLIELTTGPGFGSYKAGESCRTLQKGDVSSLDPKKDASPTDEEVNTSEERKGRNESVVMADEALEIPPMVGMPFETIPNLEMTAAAAGEAASKESPPQGNHVEEALENSRQKMYEEVLYKPKKKKKEEKRKKSATKAPLCLLEPGGPCSEGSSSLSTSRSEEDSSHAAPVDAHVLSTAGELVVNGPLHSSWPPPGKQDEAESRGAKTSQRPPLDKMEGVEWRRKSEVVASVNLRSSVVEEGHIGGVEAWLPSMPLAPDLRSPTSIRQDVESKGELLAKLLDLKPILPRPLPEPQVEDKCILPPDEPVSLLSERSYALKVTDGPDMDTNSEPPKLLLETSVSIGESASVSKKRMSLPLEREGSIDQRIKTEATTVKLNMLKRESMFKESSSSDSD